MKSNNPPIDHHYIPQFILKEWTVGGELWRYTKPTPGKIISERKPTGATGFRRRLYEIPDVAPEHAQNIELKPMKAIDDAGSIAHKMLLNNDLSSLDSVHRSAWICLIQSLTLRTPESLAAYKTGFSDMYMQSLPEVQAKYEELKGRDDPPTYQEWFALNDPSGPEKAALLMLPIAIQNEEIGQHIIGMHWNVINIDSGAFLISDEPVVMSNGIGFNYGHIAMPISPTKLFVATNNRATFDAIMRRGKGLIGTINRLVVGRARCFVGARDQTQDRFIRNRFGNEPSSLSTLLLAPDFVRPQLKG